MKRNMVHSKLKFLTVLLTFAMLVMPIMPVYSATGTTPTGTQDQTTASTPQSPKAPTVPHPELVNPPSSTSAATTPATTTDPAAQTPVATAATDGATVPTSETVTPATTDPAANSVSATNSDTGTASDNTAKVKSDSQTDITNDNNANVNNDIKAAANTGDNQASMNTGAGRIKTGDANLTLTILNFVNTIFAALPGGQMKYLFANLTGNYNGNYIIDPDSGEAYTLSGARIDAQNLGTGSGSNNTALVNTNNGTSITNNNNGNLTNNLDLSANTGGNKANFNTGNGSITTGDANVALNLVNFLNSSFVVTDKGMFLVLNVFGNWLGNLLVPQEMLAGGTTGAVIVNNTNTGAVSVNNAAINAASNTDINNNNNADILNGLDISANTGGNEANFNTRGGNITTGKANTAVNVQNIANQNIIGNFVYLMVNVLGTWTGKNLLPGMTTLATNSDPALVAANSDTGTGSDNTAVVNASDQTTITNNNSGNLLNNIKVSANTGNNQAGMNTGSGNIVTGNANALVNLLNIMNLNVLANKGLYVIVNVFGNWTGNIDTQKNVAENSTDKKLVVTLTPKNPNSGQDQNFYIGSNNGTVTTALDNGNGSDNTSTVLGVTGSNNTPGMQQASQSDSANMTSYSPFDFIKSYLKIVLPMLVVSYLAYVALYYRRRDNNHRNIFGPN